ncbi:chaperone DnaJ-domain superfamily protein [Striga asiatica]|uniref:Chaperone DnaJ-domain superfamily protein n=1 Tax=Striga asiatica TaxID=4170 RepID=A0A5A7Q6K0_STRAF|nr:chaperone DnaJ-domain superfamily protein [Striga asiatica]
MNGISIGHPHPRPCSGEKTLRRCRNYEEADNVIVIDVDADNFDNVVIIDTPERPPKTQPSEGKHKKDKKWSFPNVICIDDDENCEAAGFSSGASSDGESFRVSTKYSAGKESECGQDVTPPVRLSSCKRTYSGKGSTRNRYGLDLDYESDSSDSDYPDCELVEDSSGKVQEQWEKASSRRKKDLQNSHPDIWYRYSSSKGVGGGHRYNFEMDDVAEQRNTPSSSCTGKFNNRKDDPSCSGTEEGFKFCKNRLFGAGVNWESPFSYTFPSSEKSRKEFDQSKSASDDVEASEVEPCYSKSKSRAHEDPSCGKSSPAEDEATTYMSKSSFEKPKGNLREPFSGHCRKNFPDFSTDNANSRENVKSRKLHETGESKEMDNLMPKRCELKRSTLSSKQTDHSSSRLSGDLVTESHNIDSQQTPDTSSFRNCINEANVQEDNAASNVQLEKDSPSGETLPSGGSCIISDREKLKETDEYKRAMEEEWASRKQALEVQAEEAKRLKRLQKRRVNESKRLLDVERRTKQRIEEVWNSQRKVKENMNLKERIREEVETELKKLEVLCHNNMASLLHSLGIHVRGWPNPVPQEVQTACKRALVSFHPDRASQSDIRQQVESEEKFKLISRLKEKFSPSL